MLRILWTLSLCHHSHFYPHFKDVETNLIRSITGPQSLFLKPQSQLHWNAEFVGCGLYIICYTPSAAAPNNKTHRYLCKEMFARLKSGIKIRNSLMSVRGMMPVELRKGFWFFRAFSAIRMRPRDQGYPVVCVPELGLTSLPHSEAHVLDHHPRFFGSEAWRGGRRLNPDLVFCFAPKPRTFLALHASVLGVNFKWVFPTVGLSCMQLHSVTLPWAGGHMCQLTRHSKGGSPRRRVTWSQTGPSSQGLWNATCRGHI